jgi:hypothetical protein
MQAMARSRQWFLKLSSGEAQNRAGVVQPDLSIPADCT